MNRKAHTENQPLNANAELLTFGNFRIDLTRRILRRNETRIRIQKKPLEVLIYLVEAAPRMVPRDELLSRFWSQAVNEEALTRCISTIRKHLGDADDTPRYIETHRAQGYRFIGDAQRAASAESGVAGPRTFGRRLLLAAAVIGAVAIAAFYLPSTNSQREAAPGRIERIAVLPVAVPGARPEWLKPALSDHLIRAVSRIEGITVVSSSTDGDDLDIRTHGAELNVEALLLSRLERSESGSALSARLVAVSDGTVLWSTAVNSDVPFTTGTQVQELTRQLAGRLRPTLQLVERYSTVDERAYSHYLQGRFYWAQRTPIGLEAAIASYEKALAIEPDYVDALLGSAESWLLMPLYGAMAPKEAIPTARQFAARALELDPLSARARAVLGTISAQYEWDWTAAESLLRDAVSLSPNDATAQQWLGELFCQTSRFDECARQFQIAFELDPLSPVLRMQQGTPALYSGDFARASSLYRDAARIAPEYAMARYALGLSYSGLREWDRAIAAYNSSLPDLGLAVVGGPLVYALNQAGSDDDARATLAELETLAASRYVPPTKVAIAYLGLGERDRALTELWRAVESHDDRLVYFRNDVHFRDLVNDPGFRGRNGQARNVSIMSISW